MRDKFYSILSETNPTFKIILFIIVLHAILPAIFIIIYLNVGKGETAKETYKNNLIQISRFAANSYEREFLKTRSLLLAMSQLEEVSSENKAWCTRFAKSILASEAKVYSNIGAVSVSGDNFCSALPQLTPINISDRPNFIMARTTKKFVIGNFTISSLNKKAVITVSQPILNENQEFKGITFASIDLAWLDMLAYNVKLPKDYTLTVVDKNGVIISRYPDSKKWLGFESKNTPFGKALFSQTESEGTFSAIGLDRIDRIYAYAKVDENVGEGKVYIVLGAPNSEVVKVANQSIGRDVLILLTVIFSAGAICAFDLHFLIKKMKSTPQER